MKATTIRGFIFIFILIVLVNSNILKAQTVPAGFSVAGIASGWNQPVGAAFSKDGKKLFVWEKGGKVYVCNWNNTTQKYDKQTTPVLDISPEVGDWRDFGLLGFALDPNFDTNGLIYLLYVVDRHYLMNFGTASYNAATNEYFAATIGRITRYKTTVDGSNQTLADLSSRFILLGESKTTGIPIIHQSHGVGSLAFAADGTLLASAGDGASYSSTDKGSASETYYAQALADGIIRPQENVGAFRSQMINSLNGKLLRIDRVTGNGIPSNPFYDASNPRAPKSRVWALGFRNPFRITVKPNSGSTNQATGDIGEIYVGDVGYNTYEEMDIVNKEGANFGWPLFEGQTSLTAYASLNIANQDEPNPLYGAAGCTQQYFYFNNLIKQATADGNTTVYNPCNSSTPIVSGNSNRFFHNRPALDWKHGTTVSSRVGIFNGNNAAVAEIGTVASGVAGSPFNGNCSVAGTWYTGTSFPPAYQNTYFFGDYGTNFLRRATMLTSSQIQKVDPFITGFTNIVCVAQNPLDGSIVCIDLGATNPVKKISYGGSQPPVVVLSADKNYGPSVLAVNFTGSNSYDPENAALTYAWDFGDGNTSTAANPTHNFTAPANTPTKFVVKLTVKDNMNLSSTDSLIISVNNTPPVVNIISPVKNSRYKIGPDTAYTLQATVTDAEHTDGQLTYQWQTILRHNNHQHAEDIDTNRITSSLIERIGCNGDTYYWKIVLTVTDAAGLSTTDSSLIFPLCPGDVILPVTLTSFTVNAQGSVNLVKWSAEAEINSKYYVLERSSNGTDFKALNQQASKNLPGQQNYSFADDKFAIGNNYYRLKMIDIDGTTTYSKIIKIFNGSGTDDRLMITPNPVVKEFTLSTAFPQSGPVTISVTDVTGKLVKKISDNVGKGYVTMEIYQLEKLSAGTYFIEVRQKDYTRSAKFVKVD
jgi:glucose/arabinose dehydrogenase